MDASKVIKALENAEPRIIPDLQNLLDKQTEQSFAELEKSILAEGIRDAVVIWKEENAIVDGHNRYQIAKKHNLTYPTKLVSFKDMDEVEKWMIRNQLGRRNLTADRFNYLMGKLYNSEKQQGEGRSNLGGLREKIDGPDAAAKLAEEFGVSERTVRRAGETAIGIDRLEQIRGKIAKNSQLSGKGGYTAPELAELGKMPNTTTSAKYLDKLDEIKTKQKKAKAEVKKAPVVATDKYGVVFMEPPFDDLGFHVSGFPKPPIDTDAAVYMMVPDHRLADAMEMFSKWGLQYECSFIFYSSHTNEGVYSKVAHDFLLMGTRGTVLIKSGIEQASVQKVNGIASDHMIKLIETYHPAAKKLDMRRSKTAKGWDGVKGV